MQPSLSQNVCALNSRVQLEIWNANKVFIAALNQFDLTRSRKKPPLLPFAFFAAIRYCAPRKLRERQ